MVRNEGGIPPMKLYAIKFGGIHAGLIKVR